MNNISWQIYRNRFLDKKNPTIAYVAINGLLFLVAAIASIVFALMGQRGIVDGYIGSYFGFPALSQEWPTRFYTLLTYAFFHDGFFHLFFNMLWLFWLGNLFTTFLKPRQFHVVYWGGVVCGGLFFALFFNLLPAYRGIGATIIGASAAVMAIFTAVATLLPNYHIRLLLFGEVKLKWLLAIYILFDILTTMQPSTNIGGSLSHLGGAFFGFVYIKLLQNGTDLTKIFNRKPKLKVAHRKAPKAVPSANPRKFANQEEIDAILDKISKTGYEKLTREEKQILFDAGNN